MERTPSVGVFLGVLRSRFVRVKTVKVAKVWIKVQEKKKEKKEKLAYKLKGIVQGTTTEGKKTIEKIEQQKRTKKDKQTVGLIVHLTKGKEKKRKNDKEKKGGYKKAQGQV